MAPPDESRPERDGPQMEPEKLRSMATDVCNSMLRSLNAMRTYQAGHPTTVDFQNKLFERLGQIIEGNGELRLEVRPKSFSLDEVDVFKDGSDPVCRRLFTEGVHFLRFREGLQREEIDRFVNIWHVVRGGRIPPDHSFATLFWEANLKGVELGFVDSFVEGADADKDSLEKKKKTREEEVVAVVGMLSAKSLPGGGLDGGRTVSIPRSSLVALLKLESLSGVTTKDLESMDQAQRALPAPLGDEDRRALLLELDLARKDAPRRALCDLWYASAFAAATEREHILGVARALIALLIQEAEYGALAGALKEVGGAVRADPRRGEEFKGWIAAFLEPAQIQAVSGELDDPARAPAALDLLKLIPRTELGGLVPMLGALKTHEGRTRLIDLLVARQITGEQLVGRVSNFDASLVPYLLSLKDKLPPDSSNWFVGALLLSAQAGSRRDGVGRLKAADVPSHRARLIDLVDDPDLGVRLSVYKLLAAAGEPLATPKLVLRLANEKPEGNEREQLVRALGRLGGGLAAEALRREFKEPGTDDHKALCAEMLGALRDPMAKELLEPVARKWFVEKRLKSACRAALAQIHTAEVLAQKEGK